LAAIERVGGGGAGRGGLVVVPFTDQGEGCSVVCVRVMLPAKAMHLSARPSLLSLRPFLQVLQTSVTPSPMGLWVPPKTVAYIDMYIIYIYISIYDIYMYIYIYIYKTIVV
jgi:hypothetical protein